MIIEKPQGFSSFNKMIVDYDENLRHLMKKIYILAEPSDTDETNIRFIAHEYTTSLWVIPTKISLMDFGTQVLTPDKFSYKILDVDEVSFIEYNEKYILIKFNEGYKVKEVFINFEDISKSYEDLR